MIWNIIDRRRRPYRWKCVNAVVETVEHDNSGVDADQAPEAPPLAVVDYDRREDISIAEAVTWAQSQRCPVTLYLYDAGTGVTIKEHFSACQNRL